MRSSRLDAAQRSISSTALCRVATAPARSGSAHNSRAASASSAARTWKMSLISLASRCRTNSRPRSPVAEIRPSCCSCRMASRSVPRLIFSASESSVSTRWVPGGNSPVVMARRSALSACWRRLVFSSRISESGSADMALIPSINVTVNSSVPTVEHSREVSPDAPARCRRAVISTGRSARAAWAARPPPGTHPATPPARSSD